MAATAGTPIAGWEGDFAMLQGSVGTTDCVFRCNYWTARMLAAANDASGFSRWKNTNEGQLVMVVQARGYVLSEKFFQLPTNSSAAGELIFAGTLTAKTGKTYAGTFVLDSYEHVKDVNGNDIVVANFVSDGEITTTGGYTD